MFDRDSSTVIHAQLIASNTCTVPALGVSIEATAPVLAMCRKLVAAGHHPASRLYVYRGTILCLRVHSIGEGANLEINGDGTGFRRRREPDAAPPIENSGSAGVRQRARAVSALVVTYARTENLFNGEPWPPDGSDFWAVVTHGREHTTWRRLALTKNNPAR